MSEDFLQTMARASAARVVEARASLDETTLRNRALGTPVPPVLRAHDGGFDIIAEVKLTSPAAGVLASRDTAIGERALAYARAGAAAVSVLTEPMRFDGHLDHLREAAVALNGTATVAMRKDFLVDSYQIYEARLAGAGGVLLILRMLDDERLRQLLDVATECGLFVLLEAFDEGDLERALPLLVGRAANGAAPLLLGVNSRDLRTLAVDGDRFARCIGALPREVPAVAESGLESPEDVARVATLGYRWALIGSALMRDRSPEGILRRMLDAGRRVVNGES
ncbi:MAG: indole-3-glycerol-phosphate synthase [Pseudomonadota bacterium]